MKTIYVCCAGNINRSPFAAAVLRTMLGSRARVLSFALAAKAKGNLRATAKTRRHAKNVYGVDLEYHRSSLPISNGRPDVVLVMNPKQLLLAGARWGVDKVVNLQVEDPMFYKETDPIFVAIYKDLHTKVTEWGREYARLNNLELQ